MIYQRTRDKNSLRFSTVIHFNILQRSSYAELERANDKKLHVFATKHEAKTYSEQFMCLTLLFNFCLPIVKKPNKKT